MMRLVNVPSKNVSKANDPKERPYNHYNLYFILERELLLQERGASSSKDTKIRFSGFQSIRENPQCEYSHLSIPPLPSRYQHLDLPYNWFVHGKKKNQKRAHVKTHGVASFKEMATVIAASWKKIDDETLEYVQTVAGILKKRHQELKKAKSSDSCGFIDLNLLASISCCGVIPEDKMPAIIPRLQRTSSDFSSNMMFQSPFELRPTIAIEQPVQRLQNYSSDYFVDSSNANRVTMSPPPASQNDAEQSKCGYVDSHLLSSSLFCGEIPTREQWQDYQETGSTSSVSDCSDAFDNNMRSNYGRNGRQLSESTISSSSVLDEVDMPDNIITSMWTSEDD